jgi:hypothetical protein
MDNLIIVFPYDGLLSLGKSVPCNDLITKRHDELGLLYNGIYLAVPSFLNISFTVSFALNVVCLHTSLKIPRLTLFMAISSF